MPLRPQCLQCKKRRVKCTSEHTRCHRCAKDGYECPGYTKSLRWVEVQQPPSNRPNRFNQPIVSPISCAISSAPEPAALPGLISSSPVSSGRVRTADSEAQHALGPRDRSRNTPDEPSRRDTQLVAGSLSRPAWVSYRAPSLDRRMCAFLEAATYFKEYMFPDLSATYWRQTHAVALQDWTALPELLQNMVIVSSLATKAIVDRHELPDLYLYRGEVFSGMSRQLQRSSAAEQDDPSSLTALLSMLQQETHLSPIAGFKIHLDAVRRYVAGRGSLRNLDAEWPASIDFITSFITSFIIVDVLSTTTTAVADLRKSDVERQLRYTRDFPDLEADCLNSAFPCPRPVFELITRINYFRLASASDPDGGSAGFRHLVHDLQDFNPWAWASGLRCLPEHAAATALVNSINEWATMASACQAATTIYLVESAAALDAFDARLRPMARTLVRDAHTQLRQDLRYLFLQYPNRKATAERPMLWRFLVWPTMMHAFEAGVLGTAHTAEHLLLRDENAADNLFDELRRIGTFHGSYSYIDGACVLRGLFGAGTTPVSWDQAFTKSCIFYV